MPDYNLADKVVLVTGASSGIGRGCALAFAAEGALLALSGRNEGALAAVQGQCGGEGRAIVLPGDLSVEQDARRVLAGAVAKWGRLDVLVNSAGILVSGGIESTGLDQWDLQMNINVRSVYHLCQLALPHLLETKGNIVNVSSVTGLRAFPNVVAYNTSKAALDHLSRCVALEVANRGVRVNTVNPGVIVTECHKRSGMTEEQYQKFLEHGQSTHAMGRVGEVKEVADAVLWLSSSSASFVTGASIPVDGGRHAMCPR